MKNTILASLFFFCVGMSEAAKFHYQAGSSTELVARSGSVSVPGQVKLTSAGESDFAEVPSEMTAVTGARLSSDTVLLVGADQYSDLVAVYRRNGLKYLGLIRGRNMSVSPNMEYLVYEDFFPARSIFADQTHKTMLLRLSDVAGTESEDAPIEEIAEQVFTGPQASPEWETTGRASAVGLSRDIGYVWNSSSTAVYFVFASREIEQLLVRVEATPAPKAATASLDGFCEFDGTNGFIRRLSLVSDQVAVSGVSSSQIVVCEKWFSARFD